MPLHAWRPGSPPGVPRTNRRRRHDANLTFDATGVLFEWYTHQKVWINRNYLGKYRVLELTNILTPI